MNGGNGGMIIHSKIYIIIIIILHLSKSLVLLSIASLNMSHLIPSTSHCTIHYIKLSDYEQTFGSVSKFSVSAPIIGRGSRCGRTTAAYANFRDGQPVEAKEIAQGPRFRVWNRAVSETMKDVPLCKFRTNFC